MFHVKCLNKMNNYKERISRAIYYTVMCDTLETLETLYLYLCKCYVVTIRYSIAIQLDSFYDKSNVLINYAGVQ